MKKNSKNFVIKGKREYKEFKHSNKDSSDDSQSSSNSSTNSSTDSSVLMKKIISGNNNHVIKGNKHLTEPYPEIINQTHQLFPQNSYVDTSGIMGNPAINYQPMIQPQTNMNYNPSIINELSTGLTAGNQFNNQFNNSLNNSGLNFNDTMISQQPNMPQIIPTNEIPVLSPINPSIQYGHQPLQQMAIQGLQGGSYPNNIQKSYRDESKYIKYNTQNAGSRNKYYANKIEKLLTYYKKNNIDSSNYLKNLAKIITV